MQFSDYQNIGQYLKEIRESLHVSVEEAAAHLHIRVKYLKAIEEGDLKEMPGKAYIRGYLRNYAHYLRLNPEELLDAYAPLLGPRAQELFLPELASQQNLPTPRIVWLCLAAFGLVYGEWYLSYHDHSSFKNMVGGLPKKFAHLLDKTPPLMVDKTWETCLAGESSGCYIAAQAVTVSRLQKDYYAAVYPDTILLSFPPAP